jgi:hypothetical protein
MTTPTLYLAATIRGTAGTFAALDDSGHVPHGVLRVETLPDRVRVHHPRVSKIHTAGAAQDDTYARAGILTGWSAGHDYLDVWFARNGVTLAPADVCLPWSNVGLTGFGVLE